MSLLNGKHHQGNGVAHAGEAPAAIASPGADQLELELLVEGVRRHYGYDLQSNFPGNLLPKLQAFVESHEVGSLANLLAQVLRDQSMLGRLTRTLASTTTGLFGDPGFFIALRNRVLPALARHAFFRVWSPFSGAHDDVFSLAILLMEEECYDRSAIYATDLDEIELVRCRDGIWPRSAVDDCTANYQAAGGKRVLTDYYKSQFGFVLLNPAVKQRIIFAPYDLTARQPFHEFDLVICRQGLARFTGELAELAHRSIYDGLAPGGVLAVGRAGAGALPASFRGCYRGLNERYGLYVKLT